MSKLTRRAISLLVSMMLVFAMSTIAFAADIGGTYTTAIENTESTQSTCSHSNTKTVTSYSYTYYSSSKHLVTKTILTYCTSCGAGVGSTDGISYESHSCSSWKYLKSNHTGSYKSHYYVYTGTCSYCKGSRTKNVMAGCTADACVDPQ